VTRIIYLLFLIVSLSYSAFGEYSAELQKKIQAVKSASYVDSSSLFILGKQTIAFENKLNYLNVATEINLC